MAVSVSHLRMWFGVLALAAVAVVAGFYVRARLELREALRELPGKVGLDIQQTSQGFTLSKSEGGRTLFTIHASKATQFKLGGGAELHDVSIRVYGRRADRFDQIYGEDFEYDQKMGTVVSKGEVQIDLEGSVSGSMAGAKDGQSAAETGRAIHLRAEGMRFNQRTELAESDGLVDFRMPQAAGTARGATYDARKNELTLHSAVDIETQGRQPAHIVAASAAITKQPRVLTLERVQMSGQSRRLAADEAVVHLAADNAVQRVDAVGEVRLSDAGGMQLRAPRGELRMGEGSRLESARFSGGVDFESPGQGTEGQAGEMRLQFASQPKAARAAKPGGGRATLLQTVYASHGALLRQAPRAGSSHPQELTISSEAMTLALRPAEQGGKSQEQISSAQTEGPGELTLRAVGGDAVATGTGQRTALRPQAQAGTGQRMALRPQAQAGQRTALRAVALGDTVIDARQFTAEFGEGNRLRTLHGTGGVQVTSRAPGQPDRVSTSQAMVAEFDPSGGISRAVQEGDFRYREAASSKNEPGGRSAWAARASYSPLDESLTLVGGARLVDGGMTVEADRIRLLRGASGQSGGEMFAAGQVKSSYSELTVQPGGALLASSEPVHVTARAMNARQSPGLAHYTGGARLWQGSNLVEAQTIDFDQKARSLVAEGGVAEGGVGRPVTSVFEEVDGRGKASTVLVTAPRLNYSDREREAQYTGGVTAKSADGVMTAGRADIFLHAAGGGHASGPSRLDRIVASTQVVVQQGERRAEGERLVYEAANGSYAMSGGAPMLSDAAHGTVRGDSLTFYSHDDRVIVKGGDSTRAVTQTHISHY